MSYTILSARYANAENTCAVAQTVEAGSVAISLVDTPAEWAAAQQLSVAPYIPPAAPTGDQIASTQLAAGSNEINIKHFGAKGNGATDDTSAIQTAWNAAGVGGFGLFFPAGVYLCGQVILASGVSVRGCGSTSAIQLKSGANTNLWSGFTASGIKISSLKFDGNKANNAAGSSLFFTNGCSRVCVDSCEIVNSNCAILFEGAGGIDLVITSNKLSNNNAAISLSQAAFCRVANNCLAGNGANTVNPYQINLSGCSHSTVTGNTVYGVGDSSGDAGIRVSNASAYITATGNTIANCSRGLMVVNSASGSPVDICLSGNIVRDSQFEGCLISQNHASPISRIGVKDNHISGSGLAGADYDLIRVDGPASQVSIIGNMGTTSTGWGVRSTANGFGSPNNLVVVGNMVSANPSGNYSITAAAQVVANNMG